MKHNVCPSPGAPHGETANRLCEAGVTVACLYTQSSMQSALSSLFTFCRKLAPITRIQLYMRDGGDRPVTPIMELGLRPDAGRPTLRLAAEVPPQAVPDSGPGSAALDQPGERVMPDLRMAAVADPLWKSYREHRCFARLPLLPGWQEGDGKETPYLGFWADAPGVFTPGLLADLRVLIVPLGREVSGMAAQGAGLPLAPDRGTPSPLDMIRMCTGLGAVQRKVERIAPTSSTVLILGETGVGKEVVADAIHSLSRRNSGPFVKVNCGAIPETLIDSALFGHEKGAYTGAHTSRSGFFEQANEGTIFLDEIGELSPYSQVRLLRVLERHEIQRVGSVGIIPLNIRIIAATNRNLAELVEQGKFREDLWYRLNVFPVVIPPLRMRAYDIPLLVHHFITGKAKTLGLDTIPVVRARDLDVLNNHVWPGNVRELEFVVERALVNMTAGGGRLMFEVDAGHPTRMPRPEKEKTAPPSTETDEGYAEVWPPLEDLINKYVLRVMKKTAGKLYGPDGAAALLRIHPATLRSRLHKLGFRPKTF